MDCRSQVRRPDSFEEFFHDTYLDSSPADKKNLLPCARTIYRPVRWKHSKSDAIAPGLHPIYPGSSSDWRPLNLHRCFENARPWDNAVSDRPPRLYLRKAN